MIAESKLTFAAWTGLGITALFGWTGIYLVRNSQNLGRGKVEYKKDLKKQVSQTKEQNQRTDNSELGPPKVDSGKEEPETFQEEQDLELVLKEDEEAPPSEPAPLDEDSQEIESPSLKTEEENSDILNLELDDEEDFELPS